MHKLGAIQRKCSMDFWEGPRKCLNQTCAAIKMHDDSKVNGDEDIQSIFEHQIIRNHLHLSHLSLSTGPTQRSPRQTASVIASSGPQLTFSKCVTFQLI